MFQNEQLGWWNSDDTLCLMGHRHFKAYLLFSVWSNSKIQFTQQDLAEMIDEFQVEFHKEITRTGIDYFEGSLCME